MNNLYYLLFLLTITISTPALAINNLKANIQVSQLTSKNVGITELLAEQGHSQFILELTNGTVVDEGGILTEEGYILSDTQTSFLDQHRLKKSQRDINSENPLFFNGKLAVISSPGSENWYHWLLQILPRLIILKESKIEYDRIYVCNLKYPWQLQSIKIVLDNLGISESKLLIINGECIVQATKLIVPSVPFIPAKGQPLPRWMTDKLREIFLSHDDSQNNSKFYEKIYISREGASSRRIINEKDLKIALQKRGFKILKLEELNPKQQAMIFKQAKIIVGPHGSGFANLIFTTSGYKLIEIDHGSTPSRSFYKVLTKKTNGEYYPYYVDHVEEDHLEDDINLDITKFLKFLDSKIN